MEDKGKAVGVWLNGEAIAALQKALKPTPYLKEGTYCADAVRQRLGREGYLAKDRASVIAARAAELVEKHGAPAVEAKLDELAADVAEAEGLKQ